MTFKDSHGNHKLDWTKLVFLPSSGSSGLNYRFEISPKDFLQFAKEDLNTKTIKGRINGLSNAKRAIDCLVDEVLNSLGLECDNLPKATSLFVNYFNFSENLPYKLKIIQGLNLAPGFIVAKARNLRNKLEHYYEAPKYLEVQEAIDIAELFIRAIEGALLLPTNEFFITDESNFIEHFDFNKGYSASYDFESRELIICEALSHKESSEERPTWGNEILITPDNPEFYGFIRLMNSAYDKFELKNSFQLLAHLINHSIPPQHINVKIH